MNAILQVVMHVKPGEIMNSIKGEDVRSEKKCRTRGRRTSSNYILGIFFFYYCYYHL